MMRAWENRSDTAVVDEPLYAHYLAHTGIDHPGRDETVAAGDTDWRSVVATLTGPVPGGKPIHYQKHMAHHLLEHIGREWLGELTHCLLIRHPREVVLSYIKERPEVTPADLGFRQQEELLDHLSADDGRAPVAIIDAGDFLKKPGPMLEALCDRLRIGFEPGMLSWPEGPRDTDGVWAKYWYAAVERSTGFAPYRPRTGELPARYQPVVDSCLPIYQRLHAQRLRV